MAGITMQDRIAVARAFGLGWEIKNRDNYDGWGSPVMRASYPSGFVTGVEYPPHYAQEDKLHARASELVVHDGNPAKVKFDKSWQKRDDDMRAVCRLCFEVPGATFAAVELFGTPERVFLFPDTKNFDISAVVTRLIAWRIAHPPDWPRTLPRFLQIENRKRNV